MPAGQQSPQDAASSGNGHSSLHDLFALTDEQILEIEPEAQDVEFTGTQAPAIEKSPTVVASASLPTGSAATTQGEQRRLEVGATQTQHGAAPAAQATAAVPLDPPPWLAAQMKDPWTAEEAKELWNGVQQARQEAAAYRAAIATPEDARALKELYPGGVTEARSAAERAHVLDDMDRAYFGAAGKSAQEISASRAQLAQSMLREDPAAFREMVFAGLRALEELDKGAGERTVAQAFRPEGVPSPDASASADRKNLTPEGVSYSGEHNASGAGRQAAAASRESPSAEHDARLAAYAAFEKSANEDLERSVGAAIARTLEQALPVAQPLLAVRGNAETQARVPALQQRLSAAIRQDVEAALKGDRQLGEQIAQILSARRFDGETRGQVVRLIDERARQLVPSAAKRVLNDWTQATMAAHRGKSAHADAASARREMAPASLPADLPRQSQKQNDAGASRGAPRARAVDYRKLSDEQILDL